MFYVYVLYSKEYDKIYIGFTSNLEARLAHHNHPQNKGWTAKYKPWELLYHEVFDGKSEAMVREKQLKSARGRQFIKSLLIHKQPNWFSPPTGG
jgi:putative endonuclease